MDGEKSGDPALRKELGKAGVESVSADDDEAGIGRALRSVYEEAVSEDIPPEMLDLLGKLS